MLKATIEISGDQPRRFPEQIEAAPY